MVGDLVLVKLLRGELSDRGMHPVLYLQHSLLITTLLEPLEERSAEFSQGGVLAKGRGRQLILVSNENNSFWP